MKKNMLGKVFAGLAIAGIAGIMAMSAPAQAIETAPEPEPAGVCPNGFNQCDQGQCLSRPILWQKCCNNMDPSYCHG